MIDNILFDLDGTLTDPKVGITRCIQYALEEIGESVPEMDQLTWCIGPPLKESFTQILNTTDNAILDRALSLYRERFSEKGMFENVVYPGVFSTLKTIKESGVQIFLATAKPRVFGKKILGQFELSRFFKSIYGAELDGRLSDKGELIAHILKTEALDAGRTLMVGDRMYDIIGGKKNGLVTAAVSYGYGTQKEIESSEPDLVFDVFADLLSWLKKQELDRQNYG